MENRFPLPDGRKAYLALFSQQTKLLLADHHYGQLKYYGVPRRLMNDESAPSIDMNEQATENCNERYSYVVNFVLQTLSGTENEAAEIKPPVRATQNKEEAEKSAAISMQALYDNVREMTEKLRQEAKDLKWQGSLSEEKINKINMVTAMAQAIFSNTPQHSSKKVSAADAASLLLTLSSN